MCWGIYLAIPKGMEQSELPYGTFHADLTPIDVWRVDNPWIPLALGDSFECWVLGHAHHCSCGCVISQSNRRTIKLTSDARHYIAELADTLSHVVMAIHWTAHEYASETLAFDVAQSVVSDQLRTSSALPFTTDTFYWVQGRRHSSGGKIGHSH
ncbi:MAG: hypothetical protein KDA78_10460 [Planctomycetaceae bacterium]|nr:hypothetical protein [Planctomycetaceae bacterium]